MKGMVFVSIRTSQDRFCGLWIVTCKTRAAILELVDKVKSAETQVLYIEIR